MKFRKYSSIENSYRTKFIQKIVQEGLSEGVWQVTEKVHGANFSFWRDRESLRVAKRSGFTDGGFYSCQPVIDKYKLKMHRLYQALNKLGAQTVVVYGELYGPGVQKEVKYLEEKDFIAFDIEVDNCLLSAVTTFNLCQKFGIPHVPVIGYYSFEEALELNNTFKSLINPDVEGDNIAEGYVIKPVQPKFRNNDSRVIIKNKSDKFKEISKGEKAAKTTQKVVFSEVTAEHLRNIEAYLTTNRLKNVLSKIGTVTSKEFGKVCGLFIKDALDDYEKDEEVSLRKVLDKEYKAFSKSLSSKAALKIRQDWLNILDGEF